MELFWSKVNREGPVHPELGTRCWLWTASLLPTGYGQFDSGGLFPRRTHRAAWVLTHEEIPQGLWVLHRCDVRACCNPDHLFLGDQAANVEDARAKGRIAHGEAHHNARLTEPVVAAIRAAWAEADVTQRELAERFGVAHATIGDVVRHRGWRHVRPHS